MKRNNLCIAALMAACLAIVVTSEANAGWGRFGRGYGSCGSWGGSYYGSYGSWGGSYGSWGGSYGSWGGRWGGRWGGYARWGSYGCYGGYGYGSYGYSYAAYSAPVYRSYVAAPAVTYDDACVASNVTYSSAPVVTGSTVIEDGSYETYAPAEETYSVPAVPAEEVMTPEPDPSLPQGDDSADADKSAMISVDVPADAIVYVNGYKTASRGSHRRFLSAGLQRGESYAYHVRAVVNRDGSEIDETKTIRMTVGSATNVSFDGLDQAAVTTLKLHVPEDAKVTLAGQETSMEGPLRVYKTNRLEPGKTWDNYVVKVAFDVDGEEVVRERSVTLRSGETHELSFLVDEATFAAR